MWMWIMDYMRFQALHRVDGGLCRHTTARLKTV